MEYRRLGRSGLKVPALSFGSATFGGSPRFASWGNIGPIEAKRLVDICLDAGVTMFDSADMYSEGAAEEVLGAAIKGKRDRVIVSTKAVMRVGSGANDIGASRCHLIEACEQSLRRLGTDYIDLYQMHSFDPGTPVEETMRVLDQLVRSGKVRYLGCSNYAGWQLMKALAISDRLGLERFVAHQAYYSLIGRELEWELMPLAEDQGVGTIVWSPLGMGRLGGKLGRGLPPPPVSRLKDPETLKYVPPADDEFVFRVVDALTHLAGETGRTIAQIALNWVLHRPTVASVIIGARDEKQLRENLRAAEWKLDSEQLRILDAASAKQKVYPYWHHAQCPELYPSASA